jgi:pyruvate kinase
LGAICRDQKPTTAAAAIATLVEHALETVPCAAVLLPPRTGARARMISRFEPGARLAAISPNAAVGRGLALSCGVHPIQLAEVPENWRDFARVWLREQEVSDNIAMLVAGPAPRNPDTNRRLEFMRARERTEKPAP